MSIEALRKLSPEDARAQISLHIATYLRGGPNRKAQDVALAEASGLDGSKIGASWEAAEAQRPKWMGRLDLFSRDWDGLLPEGLKIVQEGLASAEEVARVVEAQGWPAEDGRSSARDEALDYFKAELEAGEEALAEGVVEAVAEQKVIKEERSEREPLKLTSAEGLVGQIVGTDLPGEEEEGRLLQELAELFDKNPLEFARQKESVARLLCTNQAAVHKAAMMLRRAMPKVEDEPELSQASKAVAIGIKHGLWRSPDGEAYATVRVGEHTENFRIKSNGYEQWLRQEYAERHKVKVGGEYLPQVPGAGALKDALATLASQALFRGNEHQPATRVGWDERERAIWIDLGDAEWRSVKVTAEGWKVVGDVGVRFIRPAGMLPLPLPQRGGSIQELRPLLNIRQEDFVLIPGWQAQALNPRGSYPILGLSAASEMGKSSASRLILQTVDPNRKYLRHRPRTVEDLLVIAKNNWTLGFDNFRGISNEMSDTLCMLCTGIATGKRANYTDDEEAGFVVQRPLLFNGIAAELGSQSDLLSRTIRLQLPMLQDGDRRFDEDIRAAFAEVWPQVLGALLDGLVAGLARWRAIKIARRARLADFEAFAEAACRGMGFEEGEFEAAYRANRNAQMQTNVESNVVGNAVLQMMKGLWKGKGGFAGQMSALHAALPRPNDPRVARYWPTDATRLSTRLRELRRPLEAVGVSIEFDVDRRPFGGSQKDVVIGWIAGGTGS